MPRIEGRPGCSLAPLDFNEIKTNLQDKYQNISDYDVMSSALYPTVTDEYLTFREEYGPVDKLDTRIFLTGPKVGENFEVSILKLINLCFIYLYNFNTIHVYCLGNHRKR